MQNGAEQNKTEEASPFKLKRARERGQLARGADLGFFSVLAAFTLFATFSGQSSFDALTATMPSAFSAISQDVSAGMAIAATARTLWPALAPIAILCGTVVTVVVIIEIVQLRGLVFSTQPLKPDFNRLSPANGLKRVFSIRLLKETLKSIAKLGVYAGTAFWLVREAYDGRAFAIDDVTSLIDAIRHEAGRLLVAFALIALAFAAIDQVIARGEFAKQMRMSRSELTREHKDREGEPRLKQKRKQLHAEFARQTSSFKDLPGADMLIVNPDHYAVALTYDANTMSAPRLLAKGRNHFALALKHRAYELSIPVFHHPPLARALFKACGQGDDAPPRFYRDIAELYLNLARMRSKDVVHGDA